MGRKRHAKRQGEAQIIQKNRGQPRWQDIKKENERFESYYQSQQIVPVEEWPEFLEWCRKDLPSTFRITGVRGHAKDLLTCLKEGYISHIHDKQEVTTSTKQETTTDADKPSEGDQADQVETKSCVAHWDESEEDLLMEPIKWYPSEMAWSSNLSRRFIRRSELLQKLHRFLVEDSECGAITRQEAVSMIPPMLLDVKPHHLVLDTCAAPGSKTAQIIELMHSDRSIVPSGVVIANDADHKRCYMLTHQSKRLNSPCVIITNHDASVYPKLYTKNEATGSNDIVRFDRVLCDVPCSGDGTLRKNPLIWRRWNAGLGAGLHKLQMRIAVRGLEMTKIGGRLVYSTCSFNPIENEAVLAAILQRANGAVELVDCSADIPHLIRRPGLKTWKVYNHKKNIWVDSAEQLPGKMKQLESMFPPSAEVADSIHLDRCMRIYPQLQNTGGFFIAVLQKNASLPWQRSDEKEMVAQCEGRMPWEEEQVQIKNKYKTETEENAMDNTTEEVTTEIETTTVSLTDTPEDGDVTAENGAPPAKKFRRGMIKEDPYFFLNDEDADLKALRGFYDISSEVPSHQFLVRSACADGGRKRNIYLISDSIHRIMSQNMNTLKVVNTGVRVISRSSFKAGLQSDNGSAYRIVQDGVNIMQRYIGKRVVSISFTDLVALLLAAETGDVPKEVLSEVTVNALAHGEMGCVVWKYTPRPEDDSHLTSELWLCGHNGRNVVQCMLSKEERKHFLRLLRVPMPQELQAKVKEVSWSDEGPAAENLENTEVKIEDADDIITNACENKSSANGNNGIVDGNNGTPSIS